MGEFDPDIMQRTVEKGDTLLFRGNYFVPKGTADWKRSNAVIDSLGVRADVKKAQKKQMGGEITPHISVEYDDDQSDGPVLTRRQSREISGLNKGFNRSQ